MTTGEISKERYTIEEARAILRADPSWNEQHQRIQENLTNLGGEKQ